MIPSPSPEEQLIDRLCEQHRAGEDHEPENCPMCESGKSVEQSYAEIEARVFGQQKKGE